MELEASDSVRKCIFGENSPKETNPTELADTPSVSEIPPDATTLSS